MWQGSVRIFNRIAKRLGSLGFRGLAIIGFTNQGFGL